MRAPERGVRPYPVRYRPTGDAAAGLAVTGSGSRVEMQKRPTHVGDDNHITATWKVAAKIYLWHWEVGKLLRRSEKCFLAVMHSQLEVSYSS